MKMNLQSLQDTAAWESMGVTLPNFSPEVVLEQTNKTPKWVHFGAGNIFRGFVGKINQKMLNAGVADTGIIACDAFDYDIIQKIYHDYDNLTMLVSLKPDGNTEKEIIASIIKSYAVNTANDAVMGEMVEIFENPSLQMVSFTITEKGYAIKDTSGNFLGVVASDLAGEPKDAKHIMSILTYLVYKRFTKKATPLALVSMDNCSHNGEKLQKSVLEIAKSWCAAGKMTPEFVAYLEDESKVSFPWSMIDKITPRPAKSVEEDLVSLGIEDMAPIITSKNTFIAPFVNAEIPQYLVIEDKFPNGKPDLEAGGVYITDRETVNKTETMKVTTCLNPLHTALAVYGCVLGHTRIFEEMRDPELKKLVEQIGYNEGMKVVVDPVILSPKAFIDEVINERFANPFVPDEPQRIATDTSQKVGIRFGETIKSFIKSEDLHVMDLTFIPLAIAGWLRYLLAVDDKGVAMQLSSDPLLEEMTGKLASVKLGGAYSGEAKEILSNETIFGVDLMACGLGEKIEGMFVELIAGEGAVRATLQKYLA
ncbi:mannitol dehydrogenase family protein [Chakrabartyella piscis]|uniref:mannitol dehydrogenase family protein n=1 Tax=Chakrabartyella piscis TaxID=2918914 RepID=UPI0029583B0B|nr:mannitol dehydrogenase family protein [Chakrabartyella piscis]